MGLTILEVERESRGVHEYTIYLLFMCRMHAFRWGVSVVGHVIPRGYTFAVFADQQPFATIQHVKT